MKNKELTSVLLLTCPDQKGLVSKITQYIYENNGNIIDLSEHVDKQEGILSIRVAWDMNNFSIPPSELKQSFEEIGTEINAQWDIRLIPKKINVAIYVSKYDHCLHDILWRNSIGEYSINISLIISNHATLEPLANQYSIPFYVFEKNKINKLKQEKKELDLLKDYGIDTIVLARYMQILSPYFVQQYANKILNIHHSFLPAFVGSDPYRQAFNRGVKIIGATCHYVTTELDEGPIITQDVIRISHKDAVSGLIRKGRDLERLVLSTALRYHFEHRVLVIGRKTIVFD